jgi:hypothetical protein
LPPLPRNGSKPIIGDPHHRLCCIVLGCVAPALVAVLAAFGVSDRMGWLDCILMPAMAL